MDVFAHVCEQKADTSSNYCANIQPYDKRYFCFCQMWHNFRLFYASNFHKVVRQHTEGMMGNVIWILFEIYVSFQQKNNFENPLRIDKVIAKSLVY